jgi:hypothetical protein
MTPIFVVVISLDPILSLITKQPLRSNSTGGQNSTDSKGWDQMLDNGGLAEAALEILGVTTALGNTDLNMLGNRIEVENNRLSGTVSDAMWGTSGLNSM